MFPLVNFTKETCELFLYRFIQKFKANVYILNGFQLKSLQGFQIKIEDFQQFIDPIHVILGTSLSLST